MTNISDLRSCLTVQSPQLSRQHDHAHQEHYRGTHQQRLQDVTKIQTQTHRGFNTEDSFMKLMLYLFGQSNMTAKIMTHRTVYGKMV